MINRTQQNHTTYIHTYDIEAAQTNHTRIYRRSTFVPLARSLAGELRQPLLVGLNGLNLGLPLEVLLRRHQEEGHLAALGARAADVLLEAFALAPRAQAF